MTIDLKNQITLNSPVIIYSDDFVDELYLENSQKTMDCADQQINESLDDSISDTLSRKGYVTFFIIKIYFINDPYLFNKHSFRFS